MSDVRVTDTMDGSEALRWTITCGSALRPVAAVIVFGSAPRVAGIQARMEGLTEIAPRRRWRVVSRRCWPTRTQAVAGSYVDLNFHLRWDAHAPEIVVEGGGLQ